MDYLTLQSILSGFNTILIPGSILVLVFDSDMTDLGFYPHLGPETSRVAVVS